MVDVILLERVEHLGQMGDVVNVKPGYARNYLLPQHKALRATKANLATYESRKAQLVADNLKRRDEATAVSAKMAGLHLTLVRQAGETGQLYGSVSARDIAEATEAAGFTIGRNQVIIDKPIKTTGVHEARIQLHPEVSMTVTLAVAPSQDEADALFTAPEAAAPATDSDVAEAPAEEEAAS